MGRAKGQADQQIAAATSRAKTESQSVERGRAELGRALDVEDKTERYLRVVAAVELALSDLPFRPVVVGGLAVEYWTRAYNTYDIDVLLPSTKDVQHRLQTLGFRRQGRVWELPDTDLVWEMPGSFLDESDTATEVELPGGRKVLVLRLEDILVHRIEEFVATGHADVARQAIALILHPGLDEKRLRNRAAISHHDHAIDAIRDLARRVEAGEQLETDELHSIADKLLVESRDRT